MKQSELWGIIKGMLNQRWLFKKYKNIKTLGKSIYRKRVDRLISNLFTSILNCVSFVLSLISCPGKIMQLARLADVY